MAEVAEPAIDITGSEGSSYTSGVYEPEKELDPMLVDVGFQDPYLYFEEPQPDRLQLLGGNSNGQCMVEGMSWDCMSAYRLSELEVADEVIPTTVYAVYKDGRMKPIWIGVLPHADPLGQAVRTSPIVAPSGSTGSIGHALGTGVVVLAGTTDASVTVIDGAATGLQDPERLTPEQHKILRQDFAELLKGRKDCMEFARRLLLTAALNTGRPLYDNGFLDDPVKIFDAIEKQGGVAITTAGEFGGSASGSLGNTDGLQATMLLKPFPWGGFSFLRGESIFHEAAHFAPANGVFSDRELAWAGYEVLYSMGYTLSPPPSTANARLNSEYFQFTLIFRACNPYQKRK